MPRKKSTRTRVSKRKPAVRRKSKSKKKISIFYAQGHIQILNVAVALLILGILSVQVLGWAGRVEQNNQHAQTSQISDAAKRKFITAILPIAQEQQKQYRILTSITLAQAALESDWGQSQLAAQYHNLFGVKSSAANAKALTTKEYVNGQWITVTADFAVYTSWTESIEAHTRLFVQGTAWDSQHYQTVLDAGNYKEAAQALQTKGYATDPNYATKLISLIQTYKLNKYDTLSETNTNE
ncbi:lysozyme [Liquorilactobacillus mali]|uniref:glycoside hydrolase family 73 protein n=1 Tax=Liquorilactobacillus mali TaxID=1618 RepID=UPI00026BC4AD|nr:glycoside hydrolase family 73 protein [Liquorilactobacillus mali]EJF00547.1 Muramidase [Liquorilactobacillus mali KCTC 3596 = DSM 20444]MDV7758368.1 lysozyme [Liquorilactobacillus mali]QFQ73991.1 lysozyme [Liquorilactobacillus mali]